MMLSYDSKDFIPMEILLLVMSGDFKAFVLKVQAKARQRLNRTRTGMSHSEKLCVKRTEKKMKVPVVVGDKSRFETLQKPGKKYLSC